MIEAFTDRRKQVYQVITADMQDAGTCMTSPGAMDCQSRLSMFDFDAWAERAKRNPDEFEAERQKVLAQVIASSRNQERLGRLQWRLDAERHRARTALKACLLLSGMMWEAFADMRVALNSLVVFRSAPRLTLISSKSSPGQGCPAGSNATVLLLNN